MGSAVYFAGELYVLGGETTYDGEGAVAGDVYDRVDAYDPVAKSWRLDARMPYPRHGIYPVVHDGRIYLPGGGQTAGNAQSVVLDFLER
jgi:N-acetylneuraminic acid mutarotase